MTTALERLRGGARVALIRVRSLGDCVLTTPAIRLLKQHRPDVRISVVVESRFAAVFEGNPDLDTVLPPEFFAIARLRPALCINFHGGTRSMMLTAASLAPRRAGFAHYRGQFLYNVRVPRAQQILGEERKVHTAEHLASAMFYLGVPRQEIPRASLYAPPPLDHHSPYAVLHPLAALPDKTWNASGFLAVARHLEAEHRLEPVFIGGQGEDLSAFQEYRCVSGAPLGQVMSLLSSAAIFVGNDSGPAHIAAAFGISVVVLYGSSDPVVWAPWRTPSESLTAPHGLHALSTRDVIAALDRVRVRA